MTTKNPVMSIAFVVYDDGTHDKNVKLYKNKNTENFTSQIIVSCMTGQFAKTLMDYIKNNYPRSAERIENLTEQLYAEYLQELEEVLQQQKPKNVPLIKPTAVFGGNK